VNRASASICGLTGENEANVRYALDAYPALELVPHKPYIGGAGLAGPFESAATVLTEFAPEDVPAASSAAPAAAGKLAGRGLSAAEARLVQRFDPAGPRDTPGFFIAKFRKRT
jgi:16S rRNA C967 or C1407 C5-methylase (RsmB/RsmF family)